MVKKGISGHYLWVARGDLLVALSFGFPLMKKHAIKFVYVRSQTPKDIGSDTNSFVLVWSAILAD